MFKLCFCFPNMPSCSKSQLVTVHLHRALDCSRLLKAQDWHLCQKVVYLRPKGGVGMGVQVFWILFITLRISLKLEECIWWYFSMVYKACRYSQWFYNPEKPFLHYWLDKSTYYKRNAGFFRLCACRNLTFGEINSSGSHRGTSTVLSVVMKNRICCRHNIINKQ